MIKEGGMLAWKLCRNDLVVDDVAVHSNVGGGGLGGLSEREGGGNNKYKADNVTQSIAWQ